MNTVTRSPSRRRSAFALTELVTVIVVVATLLAVLTPAIHSSREAARRQHCADNLRLIGLALQNYAAETGRFPPAIQRFPRPHGWPATILPNLPGGAAIHNHYDFSVSWCDEANARAIATPVPAFICPTAGEGRVARGTIENCGRDYEGAVLDYLATNRVSPVVVQRGWLPQGTAIKGVMSREEWCRPTDITDGFSNTLLAAEVAGTPAMYVFRKKEPKPMYGKRGFGAWADAAPYFQAHGHQPDGRNWPGRCTVNCTNDDAVYSFHEGGAQFLFADGHAAFLSEQLDVFVLMAIFTRANGEIVDPADFAPEEQL